MPHCFGAYAYRVFFFHCHVICGMIFIGFCTALFDVCMNTQAILLEIKTRHAYMSVMHAFYSVGCLSGSSIGALFASLDITVYINYALSVIALFFFGISHRPICMTTYKRLHMRKRNIKFRYLSSFVASWRCAPSFPKEA